MTIAASRTEPRTGGTSTLAPKEVAFAKVDARSATSSRTRWDTLSARKRQVLALVVAGKVNKQAAGELGLSEVTVKIHRGAVMRKMQAGSLPQLVRMADSLRALPGTAP